MKERSVQVMAVPGIPLVVEGDDLGKIVVASCGQCEIMINDGDIIVIAQKVVSKAEGATVNLSDVTPSAKAIELAKMTGRDARLCQVYLDESIEILSVKGRMVITRHRLGFECSGSGVDRSNVSSHEEERVVLLPRDPDRSAQIVRSTINKAVGVNIAVIISDSFGRHDRDGSIGVAIGIAGMGHLETRNQTDLFGNSANVRIALVDEVAAAASIVMGQADESLPVVIVRGVRYNQVDNASIRNLLIEGGDHA